MLITLKMFLSIIIVWAQHQSRIWSLVPSSNMRFVSNYFLYLSLLEYSYPLALIAFFVYKLYRGGLKERTIEIWEVRDRKRSTMENLPNDMDEIKAQFASLIEHTGMTEEASNNNDN